MKKYHPRQLWRNCLDNRCLKFGKHYVQLLMKNMKWNEYGTPAARIGIISINIAEAVKHFAAYTQKRIALI